MGIVVRHAENEDAEWILSELQKFSKFFGSKKELFHSPDHSIPVLKDWIKNHLVLIAEDGERKLGFISGLVHGHLYNPEIRVLTETFWWVPEEFRGTRAGAMLFSEFKSWGEKHVDWIMMTLEAASPVNEKSLEKRGFKLIEKQFLMEVK